MRCLHVIPAVAPRYGGPSMAIEAMVTALNRLRCVSAEIATTDADGPFDHINQEALSPNLPIHVFRRTFSEPWKFSAGLWMWLRVHVREYDLVHVHGLWSFAPGFAALAAYSANVPYVIRPAGMLSSYSLNRGAWKKWLSWQLLERRVVSAASAFHVTSQQEAGEVCAVMPEAKTFIISNAVEDASHLPTIDQFALRRRCGPKVGNRPILLFLSRLHPKKGIIDLLLPALLRAKTDSFLAIAGGPDAHSPGYAAEVKHRIECLGLSDRVAILGPIAPTDRWHLFDGAAAFVLPSRSENFGIVVAEAMARGCPVLVTEGVQARSHVQQAGAGIVVPYSADALARAIDDLLANAEQRSQFGAAARKYAASHLTWNHVAAQIHNMYDSLVCVRNRPDTKHQECE